MVLWYLQRGWAREPLLFGVIAFGVACIGVVIGFHPNILSPLTIPEAAVPVYILWFLLIAVGVLLPVVVI